MTPCSLRRHPPPSHASWAPPQPPEPLSDGWRRAGVPGPPQSALAHAYGGGIVHPGGAGPAEGGSFALEAGQEVKPQLHAERGDGEQMPHDYIDMVVVALCENESYTVRDMYVPPPSPFCHTPRAGADTSRSRRCPPPLNPPLALSNPLLALQSPSESFRR